MTRGWISPSITIGSRPSLIISQMIGKVTSFCGKTVVGWYTNLESGERACFRAEKVINQTEKAALYSAPVVQMHVAKPPEGVTLLQKSLSSRNAKALRPLEPKPFTFGKGFNDHKSIVDRLNKLSNKLWSAEVPQRFQGKTLEQLNRLAGRKKLSYGERPTLRNSFIQASNVTDLPKNFTWADKLSPVKNQGDCGSCYVISTMEMLEARLRIKHNVDVMLSPQHVLDCSFHNQGCEGGSNSQEYSFHFYSTFKLLFGDYDDTDFNLSQKILVAFFMCILNVVLLNLLISIIRSKFSKVQEDRDLIDAKTRIEMIQEAILVMRAIKPKKTVNRGDLIYKLIEEGNLENREWETRINKIDKALKENKEEEQKNMKNEIKNLEVQVAGQIKSLEL